jgi:hypothetical protein
VFSKLSPKVILFRLALVVLAIAFIPLAIVWFIMVRMPGSSAPRSLPPPTAEESQVADHLRATVAELGRFGERNLDHPTALGDAATMIERSFTNAGLSPQRDRIEVRGIVSGNIDAVLRGTAHADEVLVVGAHYDSAEGAPGANDNGSGVAALLELVNRFGRKPLSRTVRFVAFTNEEPPYFRKVGQMGSRVYAARMQDPGWHVVGMLSLETMGYFSDERGSQRYPFPFSLYYPDRGDFIGFVSNIDSSDFVRRVVGKFRAHATVPSEGGALPAKLPGVGWSDHESFYQLGVPALMVTDTAPFRYPHYHTIADTPDKIDYGRLARVVVGLAHVVESLANE